MKNRAQRRATSKLERDPKIKKYVESLADELSNALMSSYEKMDKKDESMNEQIHGELERIMKRKGEELGEMVKSIAKKRNIHSPKIKYSVK